MTSDLSQDAAPVYCDSCGERTATPPVCEDCRVGEANRLAGVVSAGWMLSNAQGAWLLAEVGRLRDTLTRRGEEYDAVRAALEIEYGISKGLAGHLRQAERDNHFDNFVEAATQAHAAEVERDRLAGQVQQLRDLAEETRKETQAHLDEVRALFAPLTFAEAAAELGRLREREGRRLTRTFDQMAAALAAATADRDRMAAQVAAIRDGCAQAGPNHDQYEFAQWLLGKLDTEVPS